MTPYCKLCCIFFALIATPQLFFGQITYVVNTTDDSNDGVCNSAHCSFREAAAQVYTDQSHSKINFDISGSGPHYITIDSIGFTIFDEPGFSLEISGKSPNGTIEEIHIENKVGLDETLGWAGGGSFILLNAHGNTSIEHLHFHATGSACLLMGGLDNTTRFCSFYGEENVLDSTNHASGIVTNANLARISDCRFSNISKVAIVSTGDNATIIKNEILGNETDRGEQGINIQGQQIFILDNTVLNYASGILASGKWVNTSDTTHIIIPSDYIYVMGNKIVNGIKGINLYSSSIRNIFIGDGSFAGANVFGNQEFAGVDAGLADPDKNIFLQTNYFGIDKDTGDELGNDFGIVCTENIVQCENNYFSYNNVGLWIYTHGYNYNANNHFNSNWIPIYDASNENIDIPKIESVNSDLITGSVALPMESVHLYYADTSVICQGANYLGTATVDSRGDWSYLTPFDITLGTKITALAQNLDSISAFTSCWITLPDDCGLAQELPVQKDACNTQGAILDLSLHSSSNFPSNSDCATSFNGNDAWLKLTIPATGNVLIRSSIFNTIDPVVEVYEGVCGQLYPYPKIECQYLDSVYYALIIDKEIEGDVFYLRIWDRDNTAVNNNGVTPLVHITAHELEADESLWSICDLDQFSNDNPSLISQKDATKFMLSFEEDISQAERNQITNELMQEGGTLVGSCGCENRVVQLWGSDNLIKMEDQRTGAASRPRIDTTAYNYSFEEKEFQINIYTTGIQFNPSVAMNEAGDFAVCWSDEIRRHNYLRIYNSSGNPVTAEILIGTPDHFQYESEIAYLENGNLIVVWEEINPSIGLFTTIVGKIFDPSGQAISNVFPISRFAHPNLNHNSNFGLNPKVIPAVGPDFHVSWISRDEIFTTKINGTSMLTEGPLFEITSSTIPFNSNAAAYQKDNIILVAYESIENDNTSIYLQRYEQNNTIGPAFPLIQNMATSQSQPDLHMFSFNKFALAYKEESNNEADIKMAVFDISGNVLIGPIQVNTTDFDQIEHPKISGFQNGYSFVSWTGYINGTANIYGQLFDASGNMVKGEDKLSLLTDYDKLLPTVASNDYNLFITAWEDTGNDGSEKGIFAQRFEVENPEDPTNYFSLGTATPSSLLGEPKYYPNAPNYPLDSLSPVLVSIIDTGVDTNNIFVNPSIWKNNIIDDINSCYLDDHIGYDFLDHDENPMDEVGHGTQVNGMIAANFPSDLQLQLMNLKVKDQNKGSVFHSICAVYYAIEQGVDIINISWGFEASEPPQILISALALAAEHDILIISSAGNTSKNNDLINKYPSNIDNDHILTVTSYVEESGAIKIANYASYGNSTVDLAAPGFVEVPSLGNQVIKTAGTSFSAPIVTRTAAIMKGMFPELSALDIKDCILSTVQQKVQLQNKVATGGILDHDAAIECAYQKAVMCSTDTIYFVDKNHVENSSLHTSASIVSNAIVKGNKDVEYHASESIELLSGFTTQDDAALFIDVDDCNCELLDNSRFVGYIEPWFSQQCLASVEASYLNIAVPNATPNFWDVALKQTDVRLENNVTYQLKIIAKSNTNKTVQIKVGDHVAPYISYFIEEFMITSEMQEYVFQFTMNYASDDHARLELFMGDSDDDVFLESISLTEVSCGN